jgi:hypothetical protein
MTPKKILKYLALILGIVLIGAFAADAQTSDSLGLPDKYKCDSQLVNGRWNYTFCVPEVPVLESKTVALESKVAAIPVVEGKVVTLESKVNTLQNQFSQLINNPPPSSTPVPIPVIVTGSSYTIKATDHLNTIVCKGSCTVTVPSGLFAGFNCTILRKGGEVTISGNVKSYQNWRRINRQFTDVTILYDGEDLILKGNLKQL